ncbi:Rhs element Vgr protein [Filimonas zeae]|uniref:Type IV secretion protein Rhs n=1 Tax=Filimonas zeae TaxID=1737353 RepID=A0A917MW90_9BACT|nr:type VI secretion system tip protein VgrG [Filimonas zeae]MDR6339685.1 Rhs element Vgr protein [Filimonas zeae]GGH69139.1 type IV secretion protein Rhs [Filimonas zeae]
MPSYAGQNVDVPSLRYTITVNGKAIDDSLEISFIKVAHEVNKISYAEVILSGPAAADGSSISFSDSDTFTPGNAIVISAAYGDDQQTALFTGVIVKHGLDMNPDSTINLKLLCKHAAVSMTFGRKEQLFGQQTDSDIITAICGTYGLSVTVTSTSFKNEMFFQKLATDWDVVLSRAEFNGMLIFLDGDSPVIKAPDFSGSPVLAVAPGGGLLNFQSELNAEKQAPTIQASAWDVKNLALQNANAKEPTLGSQGSVTAKTLSGKLSQTQLMLTAGTPMATAELQAWADNYLFRMRMAALKGTVSFIGSALVKTGTVIQLEGMGTKFNGNAYVTSVTHELEDGVWKTTAGFGLDSKPVSQQPDYSYVSATGQVPSIQGLQVGTVKQLASDPQSLYRILVTLPSNAATVGAVWARYANFYGTAGAGLGFLPEVGDEVIVGFIEGDPRYPVILGSLYGSAKASPNQASDEKNNLKMLSTRSQLMMQFDDDKKVITISTPGGNSITISDDGKSIAIADQNSNSIKMSSSGVEISSNSDVSITAKGGITLTANTSVSITAKQDVEANGLNVTCSAKMGFTAKGTASAEVSASGQTTIKGAMVMIN